MGKKLLSVLLSLLLLLPLAACGGGSQADCGDSGGAENSDTDFPAGGGYYEGGLNDTMSTYWFDFTVHSAAVCQTYGGYTAGEGNRLVVVSLTVRNVCDFSVDMYQEDFQLEWDGETGGEWAIALSQKSVDNEAVFPDEYTLRVEEEREGVLVYEVPVIDAPEYYITFLEVFDDGTEEGREGDTFVVCVTADDGSVPL